MAYTTINKSSLHFNTKLFTGTGSSNAITGVGFQPDFTWIKNRATTGNHALFDVINGVTKYVNSNTNYGLQTSAQTLTAFGADGFTVGTSADLNGNGNNIASWNWKAGGGQGSSNTDGSINTTYTSVNTTAGFSISKYSGTGSNATIGHGLGVKPNLILFKRLDSNGSWVVYHSSIGATKYLVLNSTAGDTTASDEFQNTEPTNSLISIGTDGGVNGTTMVAYAFAEKTGYSKFGKYIGNGNADGTFVYTGFKPAFILIKNVSSGSTNWQMYDNKREGYNPQNDLFRANLNSAEGDGTDPIDIYSNGFKNRHTASSQNTNGDSYIYMAFGQSIVGSNNVPAVAR